MKIVIDIPDGCYKELSNGQFPVQDAYRLVAWIKDGTPLPKGHGQGGRRMTYIACEKCKYNYEGECDFYDIGSGNKIDMPCYREKQLIKEAANNFVQAFVEIDKEAEDDL